GHLSGMVLAPAASLIRGKRLLIVADGALQFVPFAALAEPGQASYRPLIMSHEVIEEPSASVLTLLQRTRESGKTAPRQLAVFGDPVFEAGDSRIHRMVASNSSGPGAAATPRPAFLTRAADLNLSRLPATRQEARSIAALLPEDERWLV